MDSDIDIVKTRILNHVTLSQLIGEKVKLTDRAGLKVGCCPFHDEKSPSFTVYPDHYYCYGCKEHGDAISFIRKTQGLGFIETLKFMAQKYGVDASELNRREKSSKQVQIETRYYRLLQKAQNFFAGSLKNNSTVIEYLRKRGFDDENIEAFGFGYSPDHSQALIQQIGFSPDNLTAMIGCSLAGSSSRTGKPYDFFRNRLTVPIHDHFGRLIAFGGRALSDEQVPKYKNSRESVVFDKSSTLFGLHRAREFIRKGESAIMVEGYMDVLQLWQNGFNGAVACMGTAIKASQLKLIENLGTNQLILLLDGDSAGQKASLSTVKAALLTPKLNVSVVRLPDGEDPDSFLQKQGTDALREHLNKGSDLIEFAIKHKLHNQHGLAVTEIIRTEFIPWLSRIEDPIRRSYLTNQLAQLSGVSRDLIQNQLNPAPRGAVKQTTSPYIKSQIDRLGFELLAQLYFLNSTDQLDIVQLKHSLANHFEWDPVYGAFAEEIIQSLSSGKVPAELDRSSWKLAADGRIMKLIDRFEANREAFASTRRSEDVAKLMSSIKLRHFKGLIAKLKQELSFADPDHSIKILSEINSLNKDINNIV